MNTFNRIIILLALFLAVIACKDKNTKIHLNIGVEEDVHLLLNQWHKDVAEFDYEAYFDKMTSNAIFVGTDASEVWTKKEFKEFSKPYFDKKETWDFKPLTRNVYFHNSRKTAWFDEVLDTWMGVCRGSGVLIYDGENWKIQHYVLSVAIPNESIKEVIKVKKEHDSLFVNSLLESI